MKKIIVFETVDELLMGFNILREQGSTFPHIPDSVKITQSSDGSLYFIGEGASNFGIVGITYYELADRLMEKAGVRYVESKAQ